MTVPSEPRRAVADAGPRRLAVALLAALALLVFAVPVGWGAYDWTTQAPDEVRPKDVRAAESRSFSGGWATPYPPLLYYALSAAYRVGEALGLEPGATDREHVVAGRSVSVLLAVATVLLIAALGRRLGLSSGALLAAVFWLASPAVAYYAKTANVDTIYLFFLVLALLLLVRFRADGRTADLVGAGAAAVLSVASKDQAAVYFLAAPVLALAVLVERERTRGAGLRRAVAAAVGHRAAWTTAAAASLLAVVALNPIFNLEGLKKHYDIVGRQPELYVEHAADLRGYLELGLMTVRNLLFVVGAPAAILALVGLVVLVRDRDLRSRHREHLACGGVYLVFFWATVPRSYDRFTLPTALSLVLLAGVGWERGLAPRLPKRMGALVLVAVGLVSVARAVELDLRMLYDSRRLVGEWIESDGGSPRSTWVLASESWAPIVGQKVRTGTPARLRRILGQWKPRYVVAEAALLTAPQWREFFPREGYREVWRSSGPVPRLLSASHGALTNLDKVSPELVVLRREDDGAAPDPGLD